MQDLPPGPGDLDPIETASHGPSILDARDGPDRVATKDGEPVDELGVPAECAASHAAPVVRAQAARERRARITRIVGVTVPVHVADPGKIEGSREKAVRFIDNRLES